MVSTEDARRKLLIFGVQVQPLGEKSARQPLPSHKNSRQRLTATNPYKGYQTTAYEKTLSTIDRENSTNFSLANDESLNEKPFLYIEQEHFK